MKYLRKSLQFTAILLLILISIFLRFYKLESIPAGIYVDEAVVGYNSYSLLLTGKDEFGKTLPVFLRSFGAYSSPLYIYTTILPISLFGLNTFSIRFLSAFSGVLSVLLIYLILNKLSVFKAKGFNMAAAFLFSLTPWSIFFSRAAYEANFAFMLLLFSIYLMLKSERKTYYLIFSLLTLSLSTYAYQAERVIAFMLLPLFIYYPFRKLKIKQMMGKKLVHIALLIFFLIQIPQFLLLKTPAFSSRAAGLFYNDTIIYQSEKLSMLPYPLAVTFSFARELFSNITAYFSPFNLFLRGDPDIQRSIPDLSVFYTWMVVPYLLGIYILIKRFKNVGIKLLIYFSLVSVLIPALTRDPFSTLRSLPLLFPLIVVITLGLEFIYSKLSLKINIAAGLILLFISVLSLWQSYFVLFPQERAAVWGYGYGRLAEKIAASPKGHYVIDQARQKPTYILLLYYLKYSPEKYHQLVGDSVRNNYYNDIAANTNMNFGNIENRDINWEKDTFKDQILVGDSLTISEQQAKEHFLEKLFVIKSPLGEVLLEGYQTDPETKCLGNMENPFCTKQR